MHRSKGNYLYSNGVCSVAILIAVNLFFLIASGFNVISTANTGIAVTPPQATAGRVDILSAIPSYTPGPNNTVDIITNEAILPGGSIPLNKPSVNQKEPPRILIYHTHTAEAYLMDEEERKAVTTVNRTNNTAKSVCAAGVAFSNELLRLGVDTVHNTSNNEREGYNSSYTLSRNNVKSDIKKYGNFTAYFDVHRDAYIKGTDPTVTVNGKECAKIMIVLGKRSPYYEKNLALSEKIKERLDSYHPDLCIKILKVDATYNQDLDDNFILVEIGNNGVTVEEAQNAAGLFAKAVAEVLL